MLNITIDKVRHIEDKDANVRETLVELQHALDKSEQERHFYDALCIDYTAAYLCDLMADTMTVIKKKSFSHCAAEELQSGSIQCYSQWIRHSYNTFVVKESAPGFMEMFDNRNLMAYLDDHESFVYRRTVQEWNTLKRGQCVFIQMMTATRSFLATVRSMTLSKRKGKAVKN